MVLNCKGQVNAQVYSRHHRELQPTVGGRNKVNAAAIALDANMGPMLVAFGMRSKGGGTKQLEALKHLSGHPCARTLNLSMTRADSLRCDGPEGQVPVTKDDKVATWMKMLCNM